ncbi:MAG: vWA domain-containing protein [Candidatus Nitrosocaldus sp.]
MLKDDALLDIGTFLIRAWSGKDAILRIARVQRINYEKNTITIPSLDIFAGDEFSRYRQWRVACWILAMRFKHSSKYLSDDIAFGHVLNALEQKRVTMLGLREWPGMLDELLYDEAVSWQDKPLVNSLYGIHRRVIAFSQYFLTGYIKGDLDGFDMVKVENAVNIANKVVDEAIRSNYGTEWVEKQVPKVLDALGANPLITIPVPFSRVRIGIKLKDEEVYLALRRLLRMKEESSDNELERRVKSIMDGREVRREYEMVKRMSAIVGKREEISMAKALDVPEVTDEYAQYDPDLVNRLKRMLRDWKRGMVELYASAGDELDTEMLTTHANRPFINEQDMKIKGKLMLLLDHSSSISSDEQEYKRVFIALCKVLDYLGVNFIALAFNTTRGKARCWIIKGEGEHWSKSSERRMQAIKASGGTPLAEVYEKVEPLVKTFKPDIFMTFSDGEPNDPTATREAIKRFKSMGIDMVSFGISNNTARALSIAQNLKDLGYDRCVAVSRLNEIPKKVLALLAS